MMEQQEYISKRELIATLQAMVDTGTLYGIVAATVKSIIQHIERMPAEKVEQAPTGEWLEDSNGYFYCSACGCYAPLDGNVYVWDDFKVEMYKSAYCPRCKAAMKKEG